FVATVNSEKLPNGKVKGSVTVRVPPEHLDGLVLDLRRELGRGGELKGVRLGSQDVTKQYTDLESRLKAARTMEQRLLQIIKEGKGEIKQLLEAEKELGTWRTRIEEFEGEIRYYTNLVALSTLTITLAEKDIRVAAGLAAYQALRAAVGKAAGRILAANLNEQDRQNVTAQLDFEVRRADEPAVQAALAAAGDAVSRNVTRAPEGDNVTDAKVLFRTT